MLKVVRVERINGVQVTDGYYTVKFRYDRHADKLVVVSRMIEKSRLLEPVYIPRGIFSNMVRRAYGVFFHARRSVRRDARQLTLSL